MISNTILLHVNTSGKCQPHILPDYSRTLLAPDRVPTEAANVRTVDTIV